MVNLLLQIVSSDLAGNDILATSGRLLTSYAALGRERRVGVGENERSKLIVALEDGAVRLGQLRG